jgi:hypothetical protein
LKSRLLDTRAEEESNGMAKDIFLRATQVTEHEASPLSYALLRNGYMSSNEQTTGRSIRGDTAFVTHETHR